MKRISSEGREGGSLGEEEEVVSSRVRGAVGVIEDESWLWSCSGKRFSVVEV